MRKATEINSHQFWKSDRTESTMSTQPENSLSKNAECFETQRRPASISDVEVKKPKSLKRKVMTIHEIRHSSQNNEASGLFENTMQTTLFSRFERAGSKARRAFDNILLASKKLSDTQRNSLCR